MIIEIEIQKIFGEISGICKIIANSKSKMNMTILEIESKQSIEKAKFAHSTDAGDCGRCLSVN